MSYLGLAGVFLAVALTGGVVLARRVGPGARWWLTSALTAGVLVVLTAVFDSVMIAADLFRYDDAALLGWRVGLAPVEDLAWPLAAAALLPALWEAVGRRRARPHRPAPRDGAGRRP